MATNFFRFVYNLFGFTTLLTESKYYISSLRYVSSIEMVYFIPHALFSQARSHLAARLLENFSSFLSATKRKKIHLPYQKWNPQSQNAQVLHICTTDLMMLAGSLLYSSCI